MFYADAGEIVQLKLSHKRILNWLGGGISTVGLAILCKKLMDLSIDLSFENVEIRIWGWILFLGGLYGIANTLLGMAWRRILLRLKQNVSEIWCQTTYGLSQIGKYIPGNIFHFAGRQAIGMSSGVEGGALVKSSFWELCLLVTAGFLFAVLIMPLITELVSVELGIIFFIILAGSGALISHFFWGNRICVAFLLYVIFLAIAGTIFFAAFKIVHLPGKISYGIWIPVCGSYVVAWLAGLITPGAPAGIGVREIVLLYLLDGVGTEAQIIQTIVLGRLLTISGDLLYFGVAAASSVIFSRSRES